MARRFSLLIIILAVLTGAVFSGGPVVSVSAEEENNVVIPTYIFDFTDEDTYYIGFSGNSTSEITDDGLLNVASDDDPNVAIGIPGEPGTQMGWIVIKYRGAANYPKRYGELYFSTTSRSYSEQSKVLWQWSDVSEEWNTQVIRARALGKVDETILDVRYDPLASNSGPQKVEAGEELETAYIAFFATEEDAKSFNYEEYKAHKESREGPSVKPAEKWDKPPAGDKGVSLKGDNAEGSLKIRNLSGGDVEITYSALGKDYKYVLPQGAFALNGPLAGTDDLGRSQPDQFTVIDPDYVGRDADDNPIVIDSKTRTVGVLGDGGRRYVGIFYFVWLGTQGDANEAPRNISAIIDEYGVASKDMPELWASENKTFFFAEPLYGYYRSDDEWVIRKHMELLMNAGVDFLYFDVTNNYLYESNVLKVAKVCHELNEEGFNAPKLVFYTHTNAKERVKQAYKLLYEPDLYSDTWFIVDGKPLIIAPASANIDDFFTIREPQWPNEEHYPNTWPWIDWQWPQETYGKDENEAINVSVAQHSGNCEFSASVLYGFDRNRGRSYDGFKDDPSEDSYKLGTNLQLQFNRAITSDVPYVLVTGWNEWVAGRQEQGKSKYAIRFIDTFDFEYSRDIEMSRGGYFDNYYMQLAANAAAVRGSAPVILRDDRHRIDVTGSFDQWNQVAHFYSDPSGDTLERKSLGYGGTVYKNSTGRNDIVKIKVTGDATNLYIYVECADNIVHGDGGSWMQILLNTNAGNPGWYGYDYIVNYSRDNDYTSSLAKYSGENGARAFSETAKLTYQVNGKKMMVAVPLEELGIGYYNLIDLQFKVIDSGSQITTMEQMYEDGDAAPLGRLNFTYKTFLSDPEAAETAVGYKTVPEADREKTARDEQSGIVDPGEEITTPDPGNASEGQENAFLKVLPWLIAGAAVLAGGAGAAAAVLAKKKKKTGGGK